MRTIYLLLTAFILFQLTSCETTEPQPPKEEKPPGYQEDIPWPSLADSPWPMSQGDPQNTGRSNVIGPKAFNVVWSFFAEYGLLSGPIIDEKNNLYFGADHQIADYFYCLPTMSDTFKWIIQTGDGDRLSDGMILTSKENIIARGFHFIYSITTNGKINWRFPFNGLRQNYNITKNNEILAIDKNGKLLMISDSGKLKLTISAGQGFYCGTAISPSGEKIYLNGKDENLYCVTTEGEVLWKTETGKSEISPLVDSYSKIYIIQTEWPGSIKQISDSGKLNWEYKIENGLPNFGGPTLDKYGNLYFLGPDTSSTLWAIYSLDYFGRLRWIYPLINEDGYIATQIVSDRDGKIYFGSDQGYYYYCLDRNGNLLWRYSLNGLEIDGTPCFDFSGTLYFGGHKGDKRNILAIK